MSPVEIQEKLKLVPTQFLVLGAGALLFLFWVYGVLPIVTLIDVSKNKSMTGKKKGLWAIFVILFWGFGAWVYQISKGASKFKKLSSIYGLVALATIIYSFDSIKPFILGPPKVSLTQHIIELETKENPRLTLAHRIDWASDLRVLSTELAAAQPSTPDKVDDKKVIRSLFLKLFETFKEKNKLNDETFFECFK